jgi:putative endonuclease
MCDWVCYIIQNKRATYVGVSNNAEKRLRAHNGEISGGAKYTKSKQHLRTYLKSYRKGI